MLSAHHVAFIKAFSAMKVSPAFLNELRRAIDE
jgi:hypothetical protein